MVDIASLTTKEGRIDDVVLVQAEIVAIAYAKLAIGDLSLVRYWVPNLLTHVLNNDVLRVQPVSKSHKVILVT